MTRLVLIVALAALGVIGYLLYDGSGDITPVRDVPTAERKNVILITGPAWCPPCQILEREVLNTTPWQEFARREINFTVVDVPQDPRQMSQRTFATVQRYGVQIYPTMLVVDGKGSVISQRMGVAGGLEDYKRWIRGS